MKGGATVERIGWGRRARGTTAACGDSSLSRARVPCDAFVAAGADFIWICGGAVGFSVKDISATV